MTLRAKELLTTLACAQGCDEELPGEDLDALLEELGDVPLANLPQDAKKCKNFIN